MRSSLGSYYDVPATGGLGGVRAFAGLGSAAGGCGCGSADTASAVANGPSNGALVAMALGAIFVVGVVIVLVEGR